MNIGAQSGLIEPKHEEAMGQAVWLYLWFLWRQTKHNGLVLGGMPLTYKEIAKRSGFNERRVRFWLDRLRAHGYVSVEYRNFRMMCIKVMKSKKFLFKQRGLPLTENSQSSELLTQNSQLSLQKTVNGFTKNCQSKQSGSMREIESKAEEERTATAAATLQAFDALSSTPFGPAGFQNVWRAQYQSMNGGGFTEAMEKTIQECQSRHIRVPGMFFNLKRQVEKIEVASKFHQTPL